MSDVLAWPERLPVGSPFIVFAATLALSLLGTPLLMIADRRRADETMSLVDRWKLFVWLHPIRARIWTWALLATVVLLIAWPLGSALWHSSWPARLHDALLDVFHRISKTN